MRSNEKRENIDIMNPQKDNQTAGIQVIARAARILRALKEDNGGLSLGQIAERTSLARSTVQRIVNALVDEGLVMAGDGNGNLRLGREIHAMAAASRFDITEQIHSTLAELSAITGETVDLASFRRDHMVFIDQIVGTHRLRAVATIGEHFPMTSTANGKACLAMMPDSEIEAIATQELRANGRGMRRLGQIMNDIMAIRKDGMAFDIDEQTDGISAIGIGLRDEADQLYAISVPVPSYRFEGKKHALIDALKKTIKALKEQNLTPYEPTK